MEKVAFFLIIIITTFITIHSVPASLKACPEVSAVFVLGDSYFDGGNNNYIKTSAFDRANFWPYGENFAEGSTGRFCDGRIIPDFIGLKDVKDACCGSGSYRGINNCGGQRKPLSTEYELCSKPRTYLFWDSCHYTDKANEQVAKGIWDGIRSDILECDD
ncbi:GDSL esterase/lipase 1 [Striga hermonthica]|uniref:GDSL esterase/lipase 1 n=1 Tax=Striga hermonthica TaxID=68872 RepID=A0A9N7RHB0_STRHE|nr:GDSL esterase/lipase 1 [Striga hermonthica]